MGITHIENNDMNWCTLSFLTVYKNLLEKFCYICICIIYIIYMYDIYKCINDINVYIKIPVCFLSPHSSFI